MYRFLKLIALALLIASCSDNGYIDYYRQTPPGDEAVIFAEGLISRENLFEYPPAFSLQSDEFFYGYMDGQRNRTLVSVRKDDEGNWQPPVNISFTGYPEMEPIFSPDGNRLYFAADTENSRGKPCDLYYVNKLENGWSNPVALGDAVNTQSIEYYASQSDSGTIYYTKEGRGIYRSEYIDGELIKGEIIEEFSKIPSASHPYISPDESFILFDSRISGGYGSADIYISFKKDGKFMEPINLGDKINTSGWDAMPSLSPDGKYLFFVREASGQREIYWIEFEIGDYRKMERK